jgi:hypothetical protein
MAATSSRDGKCGGEGKEEIDKIFRAVKAPLLSI